MAILEEQNAEVVVFVDGQPAREYDNDDDTEPDTETSVTKYVEVVSGKEFLFNISIHPTFLWDEADTVVARAFIDGRATRGACLSQHRFDSVSGYSTTIRGEWSGTGSNAQLFKFVFADIETRDMQQSDNIEEMKSQYGDLGSFVVELWREQALRYTDADSNFSHMPLEPIPEKALKGRPLDVAASFKMTYGKRPRNLKTTKLEQIPFATFRFKHRTRKALQTLLIIDRSPSPIPLEERPTEQLSREELEELVRRQRVAQEAKKEKVKVKRERANTNSTPMPPLKTAKGANGQTVYIIDSDDDREDDLASEDRTRQPSPADSEIEVVTI